MKKQTKSDAAKAAKPTTPASPAPSPVKKAKASETAPAKPKTAKTAKVTSLAAAPTVVGGPGSATPATTTAPATTAAPAAASTPALRETAAMALSTTVVAQIDVGFGNTLYIRGEGPGLSWEKGLALDCVADDKWSAVFEETAKPIVFKFLINDQTWCTGDDYVAQPGATLTVTPSF
jgi:hypothetical protein